MRQHYILYISFGAEQTLLIQAVHLLSLQSLLTLFTQPPPHTSIQSSFEPSHSANRVLPSKKQQQQHKQAAAAAAEAAAAAASAAAAAA